MSSGLYNVSKNDFDKTFDPKAIRAYGDTMNDGKVQMSFTLPVKNDEKGAEAARLLAKKMGIADPSVAHRQTLDAEYTFYVVYGSCVHSVDYTAIQVLEVETETMEMEEVNEYIRSNIGRKVVVIGASTGTDAHKIGRAHV